MDRADIRNYLSRYACADADATLGVTKQQFAQRTRSLGVKGYSFGVSVVAGLRRELKVTKVVFPAYQSRAIPARGELLRVRRNVV